MKTILFVFLFLFVFLAILSSPPSQPKNNLILNSINTRSHQITLEDSPRVVDVAIFVYPKYIESTSFSDGTPCSRFSFWSSIYISNAIGAKHPFLPDGHTAYLFPESLDFPPISFETDGRRIKMLTPPFGSDTVYTKEGGLGYQQSFFDTDIFYTMSYQRVITDTMLIIKNIEFNLTNLYGVKTKLTSYPNREFVLLKLEL